MKMILYPAVCAALALGGYALLTAANAGSPAALADAAEDYTSRIANPSFEDYTKSDADKKTETSDGLRGWIVAQPQGWTVSGNHSVNLIVDKDCYSDNNFGRIGSIPDGDNAFYLRMGWDDGTTQMSQTLKDLPAGQYTLSYNWKGAYANSATSDFTTAVGNSQTKAALPSGSTGVMTSMPWNNASVTFSNKETGDVTLTLTVNWISGGSCVAFDNFRLVRTGDYIPGEDPEEPVVGESPTEGVITHEFVEEDDMKKDLMKMLSKFTVYMTNNVQTISALNKNGEAMISFKGENTLGNNEQGVRHNADMGMICAFLAKYAKDQVALPEGISWQTIEDLAMKSLVYSYSTHKANKLYACKDNNYWGSTSKTDNQWESSLWAMSVAYSAFFQWDRLNQTQKDAIQKMLEAECQYELERTIPTGFSGDTKAEENGWEADILAATLGLFPHHEKAEQWFKRLREFAINSYSHSSDAENNTVIDPDYDQTTVADLYVGQNLYDDYTLQNHNLFHTSYQNVVMQELGEAALALKLFQTGLYGEEIWKTNALMHNNEKVMNEVLNWLALADGELAMPNGNDWSLFLFDQITSYSTMACFLKDPNALFLENMAYKYIQARQKTTADGSWLLRADVGGRRMGVEGHRVMMTCLMHIVNSTKDVAPATWNDFMTNYGKTKFFPSQNVIRSSSDSRFVTFSWSTGLNSSTGYIASQNPDNNKIIVPFRANGTGNFLGWYTVSGKSTDASPVVKGIYEMNDDSFAMNGELNVNGATLNNRFAIYSTPGNAVIYIDNILACNDASITKEQGGLMAISMDEFTKTNRKFFSADNEEGVTLDGIAFTKFDSDWANIDNELGFVAIGNKGMGFGDRANNNSIMTAKFSPLYSDVKRDVKAGETADRRNVIYYTSVDAAATKALRDKAMSLTDRLPEGWNGIIAADPDGSYYALVSNFTSMDKAVLSDIALAEGAPVFAEPTDIKDGKSSVVFVEQLNNSYASPIRAFVKDADVTAVQDEENPEVIYVASEGNGATPSVTIISGGKAVTGTVNIPAGACAKVYVENGAIKSDAADFPSKNEESLTDGYTDITAIVLENNSFEDDLTYGTLGEAQVGNVTYNPAYYNEVAPIDPAVVNILPVKGWENHTDLTSTDGNRPYRRMYSMPYSVTTPCASTAGNYTASCSPILGDENIGKRCLTVLNSWANGNNFITQTANLNDGEYRVLITAKYECTNETSNDGKVIKTSGNNDNTSLTGVKYGDTELYAYPSSPAAWETLVYDFLLTEATPVTFSLGYSSSAVVGAANQSLLYLDNVRILRKGDSAVEAIPSYRTAGEAIYTIDGLLVRKAGEISSEPLPAGIYVKGGKKIIVK